MDDKDPQEQEPMLDPRTGLPIRPKAEAVPEIPPPAAEEAEPAAGPAPEPEPSVKTGPVPEPAEALKKFLPAEEPAPVSGELPGESEEDIRREMKAWNWGAFLTTWIWGIGNRTPIAFLALLPFVNIVMMFVLGFKGNSWAWKNKTWYSLAHFRDTQRRWAKWAVILGVIVTVLAALGVCGVMSLLKKNEPYQKSLAYVQANSEIQNKMGAPIRAGFFITGSARFSGPQAEVQVAYPVKGPRDSGTVYVVAHKQGGAWVYEFVGIELKRQNLEMDMTSAFANPAASPAAVPSQKPVEVPAAMTPSASQTGQMLVLKNGNRIRGRVVSENASRVILDTPDMGEIVFSRDEIESVVSG